MTTHPTFQELRDGDTYRLAYITADDEDAATEIALRMLDVLRVTTITQEAS
jgi:hypothetical protein